MNLQEVYGMSVEEFGKFVDETISDEDIVEMFRYANIITDEEKENILNKKESENENNE